MKKLILNRLKKVISVILVILTTMLLSTISFEVSAADPKVSIIIPVYNTPQNLLRDCLESAKNQTLKEIEIICVDDGSTDGSGKILDEYAKSDPRFKVIHQENAGVSVARNKGMEIAKGEYIKFLDSDDTIDLTTSEKCYNAAKEYNADIVKYSLKDVELGKYFGQCTDRLKIINAPVFRHDLLFEIACARLYRNKFIKDNGLNFFENVHYREDSYFSAICVPKANKVVLIPDQLYTYKNNPISATHNTARQAKHRQSSAFLGIKLLYNNWKSCGHFKHDIAKIEFLHWLLSVDDFKLFDVFQGGSAQFDKIFREIMDPELLQDDVINQLPIKEKIKLKSIMWIANLKIKPRKALYDGIYTISSKLDPNICLDINQCSKNDKANLQLWQKNGTDAQKFKVQYNSHGYYTIKAMCSGKFIDVANSDKQDGTNIWQYSGNGTDAQKWLIIPDGEGYYCLVSKCNNLCMDDSSVKAKNGANIHCWYMHGGDNQRFKLEKCEDKPSSSKSNTAQKTAGKPRPKKPVKIRKKAYKPSEDKKDTGKPGVNKPGEDKPTEAKKSA